MAESRSKYSAYSLDGRGDEVARTDLARSKWVSTSFIYLFSQCLCVFVSAVSTPCNRFFLHIYAPSSCWVLCKAYSTLLNSNNPRTSNKFSRTNSKRNRIPFHRHRRRMVKISHSLAFFTTCRRNGEDTNATAMNGKLSVLRCGLDSLSSLVPSCF